MDFKFLRAVRIIRLVDIKLNLSIQDSTITIKLLYMITYVCQNFDIHDVQGQIPKSILQASYFLPTDFPNSWSKASPYLNRMKDC